MCGMLKQKKAKKVSASSKIGEVEQDSTLDNYKQNIQTILQQISDVLLINGGFLNNQGLYSGEMGLVLFFTRYTRYSQNDLYLDYAYSLMEKIQNRIHRNTPVNYKEGLAGIGSAIEYLVQNDFFEADTDEILEDFDERIFFTYNLSRLSIEEIRDVGYYAAWRLSGNSVQKDAIRQIIQPHTVIPNLCVKTIPACFIEKTYNHCAELVLKNDFWNKDMGLQNGLAGWGISLLTELDGDDSWFSLFPNDLIPEKK